MSAAIKCDCGKGHKVLITYPSQPQNPTPCCSCTVAKYETIYGPFPYPVTPAKS